MLFQMTVSITRMNFTDDFFHSVYHEPSLSRSVFLVLAFILIPANLLLSCSVIW